MARTRPKRVWIAAALVSLSVHLVVLLLFMRGGTAPPYAEPASVNVELAPRVATKEPEPKDNSEAKARSHRPEENSSTGSRDLAVAAARESVVPHQVEETATREVAKGEGQGKLDSAGNGAGGQALKDDGGCDLIVFLSAAERRRCERNQMAAARQHARKFEVEADLQTGRFRLRDPTPYLSRNPKNGCKSKAGGGSGLGAKDVPLLGIACEFDF